MNPEHMEFSGLQEAELEKLSECTEQMEKLDALACTFEEFPHYRSPVSGSQVVRRLLESDAWKRIKSL